MLKITMAVIAVMVCGVIGIAVSNRYKLRVTRLSECLVFLQRLKSLIELNRISTKEIFKELSKSEALKNLTFIKHTSDLLEKNPNFPMVFGISLDESNTYGLTQEDKGTLSELAEIIGSYDAKAQCESIGLIESKIKLALENAREQYKTNGKLARTLGICGGIAAALLFI